MTLTLSTDISLILIFGFILACDVVSNPEHKSDNTLTVIITIIVAMIPAFAIDESIIYKLGISFLMLIGCAITTAVWGFLMVAVNALIRPIKNNVLAYLKKVSGK